MMKSLTGLPCCFYRRKLILLIVFIAVAPAFPSGGLASPAALVFPKRPGPFARYGQEVVFDSAGALVVSAPGEETRGAVHVLMQEAQAGGGWYETQHILPPEGRAAAFGRALSASGDYLFVGAPETSDGAGAVFVYQQWQGRWVWSATLTPLEASPGDHYGAALHSRNGILVVGAPGRSVGGRTQAGAVYLYALQTDGEWGLQTVLTDVFPENGAAFGSSVAMSGDWLAVGVPYKDAEEVAGHVVPANSAVTPAFAIAKGDQPFCGTDVGAVYLFLVNPVVSEIPLAALAPSNAECGDHFGWNISLTDSWLAVGVPGKDVGDYLASGQVYLYQQIPGRTAWREWGGLGSLSPAEYRHFGASVFLDGERLLVGSPGEASPVFRGGAVHRYLYQVQEWTDDGRLVVAPALAYAGWGESVALDSTGSRVAVGAPFRSFGVQDAGMVAVFSGIAPVSTGSFDFTSGRLELSGVQVEGGPVYAATLLWNRRSDPYVFTLEEASVMDGTSSYLGEYNNGSLYLPRVRVTFQDGRQADFTVRMKLIQARPMQFQLEEVRR